MDVLANIGFDWQVALANFVNFLIVFWILKKYVFKPIGKTIEERNALIDSGIENAKNSENELRLAQEKAEEEIKNARSEANQIVARAKENGDDLLGRAQKDADQKADIAIAEAQKAITKQKEQMEKELLEKTAGLVAKGVSKILDEDIDDAKNADLNQRALEAMKQA